MDCFETVFNTFGTGGTTDHQQQQHVFTSLPDMGPVDTTDIEGDILFGGSAMQHPPLPDLPTEFEPMQTQEPIVVNEPTGEQQQQKMEEEEEPEEPCPPTTRRRCTKAATAARRKRKYTVKKKSKKTPPPKVQKKASNAKKATKKTKEAVGKTNCKPKQTSVAQSQAAATLSAAATTANTTDMFDELKFSTLAETLRKKLQEKYSLHQQLAKMKSDYDKICADVDLMKKPLMDL